MGDGELLGGGKRGLTQTVAWEVLVVALVWLLVIVSTLSVSWIPLIRLSGLFGFLCERGGPKTNEYSRPPGTHGEK